MIPFAIRNKREVSSAAMKLIYDLLATPYKFGAVLKQDMFYTDSPTVIRTADGFCMYSISISKDVTISGYETHAYFSKDLKSWEYRSTILHRSDTDRWDSRQCAGYAAFVEPRFGKSPVQECIDGKYYLAYLAGNSNGYEPDPLFMGLCSHEEAFSDKVTRLDEPILRPDDRDVRPFEDKTLYKSCMFRDSLCASGHRFVNAYNAKGHDDRERIFLAVSDDAVHWERYGEHAVIDNTNEDNFISGDPQIIFIDDIYVMIYFRYDRGRGAYNTFAASYDLVNWTKWDGIPLIYPEKPFENVHAHKPWLFMHGGVVYHFYCACNTNKERFIALATSEDIS